VFSRRAVRGAARSSTKFGVLWRPAEVAGVPLIVILSARPAALAWVASSLATSLPAVVVVAAAASPEAAETAVSAASELAVSLAADPARLGIVADGPTAAAAIALAARRAIPELDAPPRAPVSRLALIAPVLSDTALNLTDPTVVVPAAFPPTLLQYARDGAAAAASSALGARIAAAGVAVRATDYQAPRDGWATRSRAVRQSQRGADDLVAFFARGFGAASTFHVIPGWDLH
jgi:hypothetical protein